MDWNDYSYLTLAPDSSLIPAWGNVYNYAPINHFMRPDERWSLGAFIDYEVNEHAIAYLETGFASDYTEAQIAQSGTFFTDQYNFPLDSSYFPETFRNSLAERWPGQDEFAVYVGKRNTEGVPRIDQISNSSFRIVAGVKGLITDDWDYDISYLHAQTSASVNYIGDLLGPNVSTALNTESCTATPGCIPYEVFTYQGVTAEQAAFLAGTAIRTTDTSMSVFNAYVTGDTGWGLAAGNIMTVFGYEWRENNYERISDTLFEQGGSLLGSGGAIPGVDGGYRVNELFAEANIPLLADRAWARQMTLDLAYRWSDYSTSGSTSTYRVGLDWQAVDALRIRGGYNRAVRAPNVGELFYPQTLFVWPYVDPCAGKAPEYSAEQCARTGVTAAQYGNILASDSKLNNALISGNPELEPEVADTITFGIVIDASDTMRFSIDYWDIDIDGVISTIDPEVTLDQCALYGNLCDSVHRSAIGSLWLGQGSVDAPKQNLGRMHYQGIDLAWVYGLDAWGGSWNFNLIGAYTLKREWTVVANDPDSVIECGGIISTLCFPSPEWRHTATASYDSNSFWAATARWRYYGKVDYEGTEDLIVADNLGAQNYLDLNAVFRFMQTHDVTIGVNNVFDKEPPLMGSTLSWNANTMSSFWDPLGRYLYVNLTMRW
jgi:outer membrane receptor protein involved in Fe transport